MPDTALLVIDIQRAAFDGVRCPPMDAPDRLLQSAHALIDAARAGGRPVVFIQHCELVVCGLQSEHCVSNTTRSALQLGYRVRVAHDGHGTWPSNGRSAEQIRTEVNATLTEAGAVVAATDDLASTLRTKSPAAPDAAWTQLTPAGSLRAGMNLSNTLFTAKDAATGELRGVSVDLMRELASRLGVPLEFVIFDTPGEVADAAEAGTWDVAILAIEQVRAEKIAFSPPITEIEATYAVHEDSALRTAGQADAAGIRIAAQKKAGYELYLARTLRHATLVHTTSFRESIDAFNERRADALAGLKPALLESMSKLPDARLLDGTFMTVNHGLGTPRQRSAAAEYLKAFVEDINASGFVARSIARHGVRGLSAVEQPTISAPHSP